ncbi:DUF3618 domain-containing protein [Hyalangium rubrum]|uniref:DUF3618 domain-containing protein n=1 Tax=Hyalangium rubrum TaxID=3103134 RepID=A0ABU5GWC1_9BACT|nr:DUF3618 domain-containing protein [Hyalangium sp. s54d21]MDY7225144.1 DUF3618 domain-containing protein [Hyalangium sp. s54d21]
MPSNGQPKAEPRTPAAVRAEIERTRAELATSVSALRHEVAQATDWRAWVHKRPLLCVSAAFMVGFLIAQRR